MNKALLNKLTGNFKAFTKHPYFGYIIFGVVLLIFQMLTFAGIVSGSFMKSIIITLIYATVALGFSLLLGYGGLASLGTAAFVGLGTYVTGYFSGQLNLPFILTLLIALGAAILIGAI